MYTFKFVRTLAKKTLYIYIYIADKVLVEIVKGAHERPKIVEAGNCLQINVVVRSDVTDRSSLSDLCYLAACHSDNTESKTIFLKENSCLNFIYIQPSSPSMI